jgi:hypothetical protein
MTEETVTVNPEAIEPHEYFAGRGATSGERIR